MKPDNILWLYSQNINGIPVDNIKETLTKNLDVMLDWEVDITRWSETNLEWNSYPIHLQAQCTFKKQLPGGKWLTTTSSISLEMNLKLGGNAVGLNEDTNAHTKLTGEDDMG